MSRIAQDDLALARLDQALLAEHRQRSPDNLVQASIPGLGRVLGFMHRRVVAFLADCLA